MRPTRDRINYALEQITNHNSDFLDIKNRLTRMEGQLDSIFKFMSDVHMKMAATLEAFHCLDATLKVNSIDTTMEILDNRLETITIELHERLDNITDNLESSLDELLDNKYSDNDDSEEEQKKIAYKLLILRDNDKATMINVIEDE